MGMYKNEIDTLIKDLRKIDNYITKHVFIDGISIWDWCMTYSDETPKKTLQPQIPKIQKIPKSQIEDGYKQCSKCGDVLPLDMFGNDNRRKDGKFPQCRSCRRITGTKYYENNTDLLKQKGHEYRQTDKGKESNKRNVYQRREWIKNTPKEDRLTKEQWYNIIKAQNNKCLMCGRDFDENLKPTIDHIVSLSIGGLHTSDNIQALCKSCNSKKPKKKCDNYIQSWLHGPKE